MRGVVERWAGTVGNPRQVTLELEEVEHLLCIVRFQDRHDFTTTLLWCANAERLGIEAKLVEALDDLAPYSETEIFVSSLAEQVATEAYRSDE